MSETGYVLVTPARNEAAVIGATIEAVLSQTLPPRRWVIVSDASTDGTDDIVRQYAAGSNCIRFLRRERDGARDFGAKVHAIRAGTELLQGEAYGYLGNLDADVTFEAEYFERLLERFAANPRLGVAGGVTFDFYDGVAHERHASLDSVGGAVQLFRRACFEDIGGYVALRAGSEDALALHMARHRGWETRSFRDLPVMHHRKTGTGGWSIWRTRFNQGVTQAMFGCSPVFVLARGIYRSIERPYVLGSMVRTAGFYWSWLGGRDRALSPELVRFIRREQRAKLRNALLGRWELWRRV
jgi:glycosyltransferase involved in cell wall biosynthesis